MRTFANLLISLGLVVTTIFAAGCETTGESATAGAVLGAAAGAVVGHQTGRAGEGALIGAAVGGLSGWLIHDAVARKERDAQTTAQTYNYQPAQGEMLTFENATVLPATVRRGEMATASFQYALMGTGGGVQITETRILRRGDQEIAQLSSKTYTRTDGTWVSSQQFRVNERLEPGQYTLVQTARTARSAISGAATFIVQ